MAGSAADPVLSLKIPVPASLRSELVPMLRLAVPVVMAELGWMAMGVVDTLMVGPLGPEAISAVGVGASMHIAFAIFGMGVLLGLDTLVSQAYGAGDIRDCHRWLFDGLVLAALMTLPIMAVCVVLAYAIPSLGFHPAIAPQLQSYFGILIWSTPFLLAYATCRRYLQGMHLATPVMFALITANLLNAVMDWALIYGHLGLPQLGVAGAAWATLISRIYMFASLVVAIWWTTFAKAAADKTDEERHREFWPEAWIEAARLRRLLRLGLPAASQVLAEVGVFALATALAGTLDPISGASHQIALNLAGLAFMIPLGVGSAGAVRVGHAVGAGDPVRASAAGWTAIMLGVAFMLSSGALFVAMPRTLIGLFTTDPAVLRVGTSLLYLAAVFQLFDGIQGVITGTLRGIGDTRTPMIANLAAHWLLGLPVSYTLCFIVGWGVWGLWVGLSLGLIVTGIVLLWAWTVKIKQHVLHAKPVAPQPPGLDMTTRICDAHVHFFSPGFFAALGATPEALAGLGWDDPESPEALAGRWVLELDRHGVHKAALMASLPGDADSVATAVALHPHRFVGFFMLDPTRDDALAYAARALDAGLRTICLFPAMHKYPLYDERVARAFELAGSRPGTSLFVHCGVLSVGVRQKLGLASPFDIRFGNPLDLHGVALKFPKVNIVIPHFGAGLLREALMVASLCPNVLLDTSSSNSWIRQTPGLTLAQVFRAALDVAGPGRLLFGTDSSFFPRGWNRDVYLAQQAALDSLGVPAADQEKIFAGNFTRLFL